ncbi:MAG: hypothetical protein MAG715_00077 [Methanonatronarchaeales archaeon]|nr:hypothetical protein [Methanonatronarchaeales archaeon]
METWRSIALGLLALLITTSLVAANFVTVADRTALDSEFVKEALEEEGAYPALQGEIVDVFEQGTALDGENGLPLSVSSEGVVRGAVTQDYLKDQVETNVDRGYGYLHGDRSELRLSVDLEPVEEGVGAAVEEEIRSTSLEQFLSAFSEEGDFMSLGDTSIGFSTFAEMAESGARYEEVRAEFRNGLREEVRSEAGAEPTDSEIDALLEARMDEVRSDMGATVNESISRSDIPEELREPVREIAYTGLDGLLTDTTYRGYVSRMESAKSELASAAASLVEQQVEEELPDTLDLTEEIPPEALENAETAREAVTTLDTLALSLPVLAALLVGTVFLVSGSLTATALELGAAASLAGLIGYGSSVVAGKRLEDALSGAPDVPPEAVEPVIGVTERVLVELGNQSLALLLLGLVLVAAGLAARRGLLPAPDTLPGT